MSIIASARTESVHLVVSQLRLRQRCGGLRGGQSQSQTVKTLFVFDEFLRRNTL